MFDVCSKAIMILLKAAQKGKTCSGLLELTRVAPKAKSCSKGCRTQWRYIGLVIDNESYFNRLICHWTPTLL